MTPRTVVRAFAGAALLLAAGCQSVPVREKCAAAADVAACERAEYAKQRDEARRTYELPGQSGGGSGGGY